LNRLEHLYVVVQFYLRFKIFKTSWFEYIRPKLNISDLSWFEYITIWYKEKKIKLFKKISNKRKTETQQIHVSSNIKELPYPIKYPWSVFRFPRTTAVCLCHSVVTMINRCLTILKFPVIRIRRYFVLKTLSCGLWRPTVEGLGVTFVHLFEGDGSSGDTWWHQNL